MHFVLVPKNDPSWRKASEYLFKFANIEMRAALCWVASRKNDLPNKSKDAAHTWTHNLFSSEQKSNKNRTKVSKSLCSEERRGKTTKYLRKMFQTLKYLNPNQLDSRYYSKPLCRAMDLVLMLNRCYEGERERKRERVKGRGGKRERKLKKLLIHWWIFAPHSCFGDFPF